VAVEKSALFKRGYKWRYSKQRKRLLSTPREMKGVENGLPRSPRARDLGEGNRIYHGPGQEESR